MPAAYQGNASLPVTAAVLVAPSSTTHSINMHQRVVGLAILGHTRQQAAGTGAGTVSAAGGPGDRRGPRRDAETRSSVAGATDQVDTTGAGGLTRRRFVGQDLGGFRSRRPLQEGSQGGGVDESRVEVEQEEEEEASSTWELRLQGPPSITHAPPGRCAHIKAQPNSRAAQPPSPGLACKPCSPIHPPGS